jgi:hypothetical protein
MNKEVKKIIIDELKMTRLLLKSRIEDCVNNKNSSVGDLDMLFERCKNIDNVLKEMNNHE